MSDHRALSDYIELAVERREANSGRELAKIAQDAGFDISHSTINRIRTGRYLSVPTSAILKAVAYLAREPEADVFAAAAVDESQWADFDAAFNEWLQAKNRVDLLADRYARLRGLTLAAAREELEDLAQQVDDWRAGRAGWYPPWDPESTAARRADRAEKQSDSAKREPFGWPAATEPAKRRSK